MAAPQAPVWTPKPMKRNEEFAAYERADNLLLGKINFIYFAFIAFIYIYNM